MSERRSSTICAVVKRPDHHSGLVMTLLEEMNVHESFDYTVARSDGLSQHQLHYFFLLANFRYDDDSCDNFRPEVDSDVISGVVVEATGMKVRVKSGDSRSNRSPDI